MDGLAGGSRGGAVRGGVAGHPKLGLAQQAIRVGVDPLAVLRSGDPVEQLVLSGLVKRADEARSEELARLVRAAGITAGQTMALIFGADPVGVVEWGELLMGGD